VGLSEFFIWKNSPVPAHPGILTILYFEQLNFLAITVFGIAYFPE